MTVCGKTRTGCILVWRDNGDEDENLADHHRPGAPVDGSLRPFRTRRCPPSHGAGKAGGCGPGAGRLAASDMAGWELLASVYAGLSGFEERSVEAFRPLAERAEPRGTVLAARVALEADRPGLAVEWLQAAHRKNPESEDPSTH